MIGLAKRFGFTISHNYDEEVVLMRLCLWEWEPQA
jgi:acetyltransferase